jgi:hypothetical protein
MGKSRFDRGSDERAGGLFQRVVDLERESTNRHLTTYGSRFCAYSNAIVS